MKYKVTYNKYDKNLDLWHDIVKVFNSLPDAIDFVAKLNKLREWESVTIAGER